MFVERRGNGKERYVPCEGDGRAAGRIPARRGCTMHADVVRMRTRAGKLQTNLVNSHEGLRSSGESRRCKPSMQHDAMHVCTLSAMPAPSRLLTSRLPNHV